MRGGDGAQQAFVIEVGNGGYRQRIVYRVESSDSMSTTTGRKPRKRRAIVYGRKAGRASVIHGRKDSKYGERRLIRLASSRKGRGSMPNLRMRKRSVYGLTASSSGARQ